MISLGGPSRNRTCNPRIKSPLLCLVELLALFGTPGAIRTPNPQIRSLMLYPVEPRARIDPPGDRASRIILADACLSTSAKSVITTECRAEHQSCYPLLLRCSSAPGLSIKKRTKRPLITNLRLHTGIHSAGWRTMCRGKDFRNVFPQRTETSPSSAYRHAPASKTHGPRCRFWLI